MCGIVGGIAERNLAQVLVEGLKRLEYRGYDSAGLSLLGDDQIVRERQVGKVAVLEKAVQHRQLYGTLGIAHTRWATHGEPTQKMPIRICQAALQSSITGLLKTTKISK